MDIVLSDVALKCLMKTLIGLSKQRGFRGQDESVELIKMIPLYSQKCLRL